MESGKRNRRRRGAALALIGVGVACLPMGGATASCAEASLDVGSGATPARVSAGSEISVDGRGFVNGCDDGGSQSVLGCSTSEGEQETPLSDVTLVIRQDGREFKLGTEDAGLAEDNEMGQISWEATLPSGVRPGPAVLSAGTAKHRVTITE